MKRSLSSLPGAVALHAAGLLTLASMSAGQAPSVQPQYSISLPTPGFSHAVESLVNGRLNETSLLDIAVLRNGRITVAYDPALGEASAHLPGIYSDLAGTAPASANGLTKLITVGNGMSLTHLAYDTDSRQFIPEEVFDQVTEPFAYAAWQGASRVYADDLDGIHGGDLIGVKSDRVTLQMATANGVDSFTHVPASVFAPAVNAPVSDLCIARAAGNSPAKVCVVAGNKLFIFRMDGSSLSVPNLGGDVLAVESIESTISGSVDLAVLTHSPSGSRHLHILEGANLSTIQSLDLSPIYPTAMTVGDFNGDQSSDLAITVQQGNQVVCLLRINGVFSLGPANLVNIPNQPPTGAALGQSVCITDIDNDGDADVLFAVNAADELFMAKNPTIDHESLAPRILAEGPGGPLHIWMPNPETLSVRCEWPSASRPAPSLATHLQVIQWSAEEVAADHYATDAIPAFNTSFPLAGGPHVQKHHGLGVNFIGLELSAFDAVSTAADLHYLTLRYVTLDANLQVTESWPHSTTYVASFDNPNSRRYLEGLSFVVVGGDLLDAAPSEPSGNNGTGVSGGTQVGGTGATGCIPDYPPGPPPATTPTQEP